MGGNHIRAAKKARTRQRQRSRWYCEVSMDQIRRESHQMQECRDCAGNDVPGHFERAALVNPASKTPSTININPGHDFLSGCFVKTNRLNTHLMTSPCQSFRDIFCRAAAS